MCPEMEQRVGWVVVAGHIHPDIDAQWPSSHPSQSSGFERHRFTDNREETQCILPVHRRCVAPWSPTGSRQGWGTRRMKKPVEGTEPCRVESSHYFFGIPREASRTNCTTSDRQEWVGCPTPSKTAKPENGACTWALGKIQKCLQSCLGQWGRCYDTWGWGFERPKVRAPALSPDLVSLPSSPTGRSQDSLSKEKSWEEGKKVRF